jgi:sulfide:quinone oxidoreductase
MTPTQPTPPTAADVLILGGGTAGITTAAQLRKQRSDLQIRLLEPAEYHYYQPAWTLVGGGTYDLEATRRPMRSVIPDGVHWVQASAVEIDPASQRVTDGNGTMHSYHYLIVALGVALDWDGIPGLADNVGQKNGVCSNYSYETVSYTWECLQELQDGNAIFTQPATPIKCGGAPQKIMYLTEDYLRRHNRRASVNVAFFSPGTKIFGVKTFADTLEQIVKSRGIMTHFHMVPVEIRGAAREVVFEQKPEAPEPLQLEYLDPGGAMGARLEGDGRVVFPYTMLHTAPPHVPPAVVRNSKLAHQTGGQKGWANVDPYSLQSPDYPNVFALGDVAGIPNAKSGAAVRKEVPVVVANLLQQMDQDRLSTPAQYDGYSSCPIVTRYGRMMLAEFDYNNEPQPSLPVDTSQERWTMWLVKKYYLPWMYWHQMLKGKT